MATFVINKDYENQILGEFENGRASGVGRPRARVKKSFRIRNWNKATPRGVDAAGTGAESDAPRPTIVHTEWPITLNAFNE